jgi:hypothetical protein
VGIKKQNVHAKRRSVSFEDDIRVLNTQPSKSHIREAATGGSSMIVGGGNHVRESARAGPDRGTSDAEDEKEKEERRKERRRQEAQAAIEVRFFKILGAASLNMPFCSLAMSCMGLLLC